MNHTILLVSDNSPLTLNLRSMLLRDRYQVRLEPPTAEMFQLIQRHKPTAIILASESTTAPLLGICQQIHAMCALPLIMVSDRYDAIDEISALAAGAFDYVIYNKLSTTFKSRIERMVNLTFSPSTAAVRPVTLGELRVDPMARVVTFRGSVLPLTRIEFDLINILSTNAHRVVYRRELIDRVWGQHFGDDHVLEVHLSRLRHKILKAGGPRIGQCVRGVGYRLARLEAEVG